MRAVKVGKIQYRIVCAQYGTDGHTSHTFHVKDRPDGARAIIQHDALSFYACAPWRVEGQAISEWGDPDAAELCLYAIGRTLEGKML